VPFLVFESRDLVVASPERLGKSIVILLRRENEHCSAVAQFPSKPRAGLSNFRMA
jgi:hypothetical protein